MELNGLKVVVTGAAGFVGAHLVRRLCNEKAIVHAFIRPGTNIVRLVDIQERIIFHQIDLKDNVAVKETLASISPQGVFHLAATSQSYEHVPSVDDVVDVNIGASIKLMDMIKEHSDAFFVNTSSFVEVGKKKSSLREDDTLEPTELYGISRIPALLYGQALGRDAGKPFVSIRVFTPYGPFIQKGKLIYNVITSALQDKEIQLTRPEITRDFIYIDDLIEIYIAAALHASEYPGHIFNGGSGESATLKTLVELILQETGSSSHVQWNNAAVSYDSNHWEADTAKIREKLGWRPTHSLKDGITDTIAWFKAREEYWR